MIRKEEACPEPSPHGWTLDTLEEFVSTKIKNVEKYFADLRLLDKESVATAMTAAEKAIAAAMTASEKAILKAEAAAEKRSEASNEIRAAMIDQQKNFADKPQTEFRFGAWEQRLDETNKVLTKRLDGIDLALSATFGKTQGFGMSAAIVVQIIATVASITTMAGVIAVLIKH